MVRSGILSLLFCLTEFSWCYGADPAVETMARLSASLGALRLQAAPQPELKERIQENLLQWIDVRMKKKRTVEEMNEELRAAGYLSAPQKAFADCRDPVTAALGEISIRPAPGAPELLAVESSIYAVSGCAYDVTLAIYRQNGSKRIMVVNASNADDRAEALAGLAVSHSSRPERTMVASTWTSSRRDSKWGGAWLRIDLLDGGSPMILLQRPVRAKSGLEEWRPLPFLRQNEVTFLYLTRMYDNRLLERRAIERYSIEEDHVVRQGPVALTRAGFLDEWLKMGDEDVTRWSTPEAAAARRGAIAVVQKGFFAWEHVSRCPGAGANWEIGITNSEASKTFNFLMSAASVSDLRMLSVAAERKSGCTEVDFKKDISILEAELPGASSALPSPGR